MEVFVKTHLIEINSLLGSECEDLTNKEICKKLVLHFEQVLLCNVHLVNFNVRSDLFLDIVYEFSLNVSEIK